MSTLLPVTHPSATSLTPPALHERPFVARYLVRRKPGLSWEAFKRHQLEVHVPLALQLPGLLDYRLHLFEPVDGAPQAFDAMAEVTFATAEDHDAVLASATGQEAVGDLPNYLDTEAMVVLRSSPALGYLARLDR